MIAALALLSARDAARGELRECGGIIVEVMTKAPEGVKAMAAAIAAVAREISGGRTLSSEWSDPGPRSWLPGESAQGEAEARVPRWAERPGTPPLHPIHLDLPPPLA